MSHILYVLNCRCIAVSWQHCRGGLAMYLLASVGQVSHYHSILWLHLPQCILWWFTNNFSCEFPLYWATIARGSHLPRHSIQYPFRVVYGGGKPLDRGGGFSRSPGCWHRFIPSLELPPLLFPVLESPETSRRMNMDSSQHFVVGHPFRLRNCTPTHFHFLTNLIIHQKIFTPLPDSFTATSFVFHYISLLVLTNFSSSHL